MFSPFSRNLADLKDFVVSMKDGDKAKEAKAEVEEKAAEVFTVHLDVDNFKDQVKEGDCCKKI